MHERVKNQYLPSGAGHGGVKTASMLQATRQRLPHAISGPVSLSQPLPQDSIPGAASDLHEREADVMSEQVVHSLSNGEAKKDTNSTKSGIVSNDQGSQIFGDSGDLNRLGTGHPMDKGTQSIMEGSLGHSFGSIRIHNAPQANESASAYNALAYTRRNHIVFGQGQYQPGTSTGKKLLAHELTHSIQQAKGIPAFHNGSPIIQRFASEEHQKLGNAATGKAQYNLGDPQNKFELTHGDIVALSGDVFMPEELFKLAAIPGDKGTKKGTRDEILWALQDTRIWEMRAEKTGTNPFAQQKDARFEPGGLFAGFVFSDDVKAAVFEKYQKLGAANASHFVAPQGRTKTGEPVATSESVGSKYVKYHEEAISTADKAGRAGANTDRGMAFDAAAQHYLTDAFSAGHLRTPIASIREYWGNKYPLFWYNLRQKISLDTAIEMTKGTAITNHFGYSQILQSVEAMAPTLPAVTLGDLIASIYHDVDNEKGINIKGGGKIFGDKNLDTGTENLAVGAIKASNNDISKAHDHGKTTTTPVPDKDLFDAVRKAGGGSSTKYAAELLIPEPDTKEPAQNWKAADINVLWDQKFLGKSGDTVGQVISKRVQGGSIAIQLTALAGRFPVQQNAVIATLRPRDAYLNGFVKKLQANPKAGVLDIVHWAPHDMSTGTAPREVTEDLKARGAAGNKTENLGNLTGQQRVKFVRGLLSDARPQTFPDPASYDSVIDIFDSISASERFTLYQAVEGRAWSGNIKAGDQFYFKISVTDKDKEKEVLDKVRVDKFKKVMAKK